MGYYRYMTLVRTIKPGMPHHIYNRGNQKGEVFFQVSDYEYFRKMLRTYSKRYNLLILAFCLMPNHYHILAIPWNLDSLSNVMRDVGIAYSYYVRKKYKWEGHVFQSRYKSKVVWDKNYFEVVLKYIKDNPREAKLINGKQRYRWTYFDRKRILLASLIYQIINL
jgi:putative transposase